ncbi:MAG TPA: aldehyde dehydrogenase family protein [Pyrinomonadaceae bacterium]
MSVQTLDTPTTAERELIVSVDPATGEELGRTPVASAADVAEAVGRARAAQKDWAARSFRERGAVVMRARKVILEELEEIARLISRECGKPVAEAISMELAPTLDLMQYFARRTEGLLRPQRVEIGQYGLLGRSSRILYRPLGVVGIISPWNFPWAIPLGEVVMALMAGNGVVLKPSELTTLVGLKINDVFRRACLPAGLLETVAGAGATGAALVSAGVDKIMFTGSVTTGKRVAEAAARQLIPVVLELGGKDPMIVLEDADVEVAASAAVWGAFCNSGQACASVERCYVQEAVAPRFTAAIVRQTRLLKQTVGRESDADIGAMSSERQLNVVAEHVEDALGRGARALTGGRRAPDLSGPFYEPTVLVDVTQDMLVMREETFGPVLPVLTFKTEEEAINLANDSPFGLTASVWTKNIVRGRRIASRIEAGTVMVNEVLYTHGVAQTPWGGMKQSGIGRTHGRLGLLELVTPQHIHVNRISSMRDLWWFRYTPRGVNLFRGFARRFSSGSVLQTSLLVPQMIRRLFERRD